MDVFTVKCDVNRYQILDFVDEEDWDREAKLGLNTGKTLAGNWRPFKVEVLTEDEEDKNLLPSDFPCIGGNIPTFTLNAVDCLRDILEVHGEILPLKSKTGKYFAYNITRVVEALDLKKSEYDTYQNGKIREIKKHVLIPKKIGKLHIFKMKEKPMSFYATEHFIQLIKKNNLCGFEFEKVWSSS